MKLYPPNIETVLDFNQVKTTLLKQVYCPEGSEMLECQSFFTHQEDLLTELIAVSELKDIFVSGEMFSTLCFVKVNDILSVFDIEGRALNEDQLFRLHHLIKGTFELLKFFSKKERIDSYPVVTGLFLTVSVDKKWYLSIEQILDLDKVQIKCNASEELIKIRTKIAKLEKTQDILFNTAIKEYAQQNWLADQKESFRSGRRVLAVLSENKRKVNGTVLDISGNGNITYIEPAAVLPVSSEISEWQIKERKEIERILKQITADLRPFQQEFKLYKTVVAQLDAWQAKSRLAILQNAVAPQISATEIHLKHARHPVLEKHLKEVKREIIPLDIQFTSNNRVIVISGPNAGGKSVAMKTVGILQLMFQFGLHIPAEEGSQMMLFEQLMANIGDDQSIEDDLSTYSSHLVKMTHFVEFANANTLFLIDEMGSGTDPALGGPIAEAILEHLTNRQAYGIVTTHYSNLKELALNKPGMQNAAMSFEMSVLKPTYELHLGQAGASYAFEVAERSGLPTSILNAAKTKLGGERKVIEQSLAQIQSEKQYLKGIRKNNQKQSKHLEELIANYNQLKTDLEKQKKKLVREYEEKLLAEYNHANRTLENTVRNLKEQNQSVEALKKVRSSINDERQTLAKKVVHYDIQPIQENTTPIAVGSKVRLDDSNQIGEVKEIRNQKAVVQFGNLMTTLPISKLIHCVEDKVASKSIQPTATSNHLLEQTKFNFELDIRGMYKDEAMQAIEQFLDKAIMFGINQVRIIHGKGSGVLRQTVKQCLKQYPHIKNFEHEPYEAGGDGVTQIALK
jgi:DNA mismatch repair protein MutS2